METFPRSDASKPVHRFRFRLSTLFWWQVLLVPAFLSALYANAEFTRAQHPYVTLIWVLIAPICYVSMFVIWTGRPAKVPRFAVLSAVQRGMLFGVLFGVLGWGPVIVPGIVHTLHPIAIVNPARAIADLNGFFWFVLPILGEALGEVAAFLLVFGVIGAAIGGVVGIARDFIPHSTIAGPPLNPER